MQEPEKKDPRPEIGMGDIYAAAWRSLKSTQTTLYLLVAIAIASVLGVFVPQDGPPEAYTERLGKVLGTLVLRLGLDHVFSSWWYLLLLALLTISAAACAKRIWRLGRDVAAGPSVTLLRRRLGAGKSEGETATLSGEPAQLADRLAHDLRRRRYRVETGTEEAGERWVVGRKHGWAGYGLILSHLAIFAIALGAIISVWPGLALDQPVQITEGETYKDPHGSFDFALRLNSFSLEYYPDHMTVKAYKSDVSVLEGDREVKRQMVLVNHPLSYHHLNFYQSSFGLGGFTVKVTAPGSQPQELHFPLDAMGEGAEAGMYTIPEDSAVQFTEGRKVALVARGFSPDGSTNGCPVPSASGGGLQCATAQLTMVSGFGPGGNHSFKELGWVKQGQPLKVGDTTVELEPVRYYSGLEARRDYGVPLVWLGFAVLVLGLMFTFYFRPHTLAAVLTPARSEAKITLAAFEKGGAGQERWQSKPYPVVQQILEKLTGDR